MSIYLMDELLLKKSKDFSESKISSTVTDIGKYNVEDKTHELTGTNWVNILKNNPEQGTS